jgi:hypothetical protein
MQRVAEFGRVVIMAFSIVSGLVLWKLAEFGANARSIVASNESSEHV